jgi:putative two-component system protein, hydrogenase maturation factor HypX/HoxX
VRVLLLTHSFNSLTQRLHAELIADGHEISVEFDIGDSVTEEAVALFRPDVLVAPFLKRAVPESIWKRELVLIVHPGIVGDRGPSALDWAIMNREREWGVTVLQAEAAMDAGPVWASARFTMRNATKASLYRNEVTEAALVAVREALTRVPQWRSGSWQPRSLASFDNPPGRLRPAMRQNDRRIDWAADTTDIVLRKIRAADGFPGLDDEMFGLPCRLFDAHPASYSPSDAAPGDVIARSNGALLRTTVDGAVWIGHVTRPNAQHSFKLPATTAFASEAVGLPEHLPDLLSDVPREGHPETQESSSGNGYAELHYRENGEGNVGILAFDFYNGAMSTSQCHALIAALHFAAARPTRVLVLEGGSDFWSNGIHLTAIEAAASPADESWANINALNDACLAILTMTDKLTLAALRGNAGAGGCFLALAADRVWAREGVILNPHYRNMGNLHGSEYWTYLLPRRVGPREAGRIMRDRLPLLACRATAVGLIDDAFGSDVHSFSGEVARRAALLAADPALVGVIAEKARRRAADEELKPLAAYREAELEAMRRNFYGFDPSYHVARYHFVMKSPHSWTPRHLARHRDLGWQPPLDPATSSPAAADRAS